MCEVEERHTVQNLDAYEEEERFVLEFVTIEHAINTNKTANHGDKEASSTFLGMLERENRVLALIQGEGLV